MPGGERPELAEKGWGRHCALKEKAESAVSRFRGVMSSEEVPRSLCFIQEGRFHLMSISFPAADSAKSREGVSNITEL